MIPIYVHLPWITDIKILYTATMLTNTLSLSSDGGSPFSPSLLRRPSSVYSKLLFTDSSSYVESLPKSVVARTEYPGRLLSSPQLSYSSPQHRSYASMPAGWLSSSTMNETGGNDVDLPFFDGPDYVDLQEDLEPSSPSAPLSTNSRYAPTPEDNGISETSGLASREALVRDDNAINGEPTAQVDYLSYDWEEQDIWSSWRYIVSKREKFGSSARLENASWRAWTKVKYHLRTVSPESISWYGSVFTHRMIVMPLTCLRLKECDETWLYGPLQTDSKRLSKSTKSTPPTRLSTESSSNQKSILKKRSAFETLLELSLSTHTLPKQAGTIPQEQIVSFLQGLPSFARSKSDCIPSSVSLLEGMSPESSHSSSSLSRLQLPLRRESRHIHFSSEVVQYIAVEDSEGDDAEYSRFDADDHDDDEDDESSEDLLMMKISPKAQKSTRSISCAMPSKERPIIALLPPTLLRGDIPEPEDADYDVFQPTSASLCSPCSSTEPSSPPQETLRPLEHSTNFLTDEDEEADLSWSGQSQDRNGNGPSLQTQQFSNSKVNCESIVGLRRTPLGMLMPSEDGEDAVIGVFGRVVDTVNTARDIAYVLWNVGWYD